MTISDQLHKDPSFSALVDRLLYLREVAVAFSGGVDSAFLLYVARAVLGRSAVQGITSVSPSFSSGELEHCEELASLWDVPLSVVQSGEMDNPNYLINDTDRCYWCKVELMEAIEPVLINSDRHVLLGVNVDDLGEHRPGQKAALEAGAIFPLVEAGYTKALIRRHSHILALPTWDKPQAACLSSRIPYGTPVSVGLLSQLDRAEASLKKLGFSQLRVRHYDKTARIELCVEEFGLAIEKREQIIRAVKEAGYVYVTIDLEGFRSGNLNGQIDSVSI